MSLKFTQKITLDLTIPRIQNVRCVQDDKNTRFVNITITNNGEPFFVTKDMIVSYKVCKADSNYIWNKSGVTVNDDGTVTVDLSDQAVSVIGIAESCLKIQESNEKISTLPFNIIVEKAVVSDDEISSTTESDIIDDMENHLVDFNNPHKVTKAQVGLENVQNVSTNDQTPTYTEATTFENISSGEKLSIAFGKIKKAISTLISHISTKATISQEGHTKLTDSVSSTSIDTAATPNSVKIVNDKIEQEIDDVITHEQIDSLFL